MFSPFRCPCSLFSASVNLPQKPLARKFLDSLHDLRDGSNGWISIAGFDPTKHLRAELSLAGNVGLGEICLAP
jgi:hypothetical protein